MNLYIYIAIDDIHPEKNWGLPEDIQIDYIKKLNLKYGCKFTFFVPSNYHNKFPLNKHKEWVNYWKQFNWIELSGHGHFHSNTNSNECEFLNLNYTVAKERIYQSLNEWLQSDYNIKGWRFPGWLASQESFNAITQIGCFNYIAIHPNLNESIKLNNGIKVINKSNSININDIRDLELTNNKDNYHLFFQSHINGKTNSNNWNDANYNKFDNALELINSLPFIDKIEYRLFKEFSGD